MEKLQKAWLIWNLVNSGLLTVIAGYTFFYRRDRASRDAIDAVSDDVHAVQDRVTQLEEAMRHVPNKAELNTLHKRITEVSESQRSMAGEMHQMNNILSLIHRYLLTHKDGR